MCDTATQVSSADHEDKRNKLSGEEDKVGNGIMKDEVDDSVASTTKRLVVVKDLVGLLKKRLNGMLLSYSTSCMYSYAC